MRFKGSEYERMFLKQWEAAGKNKATWDNDGIYELCYVRDKGMKSEVVQTNQHSWPERPLKNDNTWNKQITELITRCCWKTKHSDASQNHTTTNAKPQAKRQIKTIQMFIKGLKDNDRLLRVIYETELHYCPTNWLRWILGWLLPSSIVGSLSW